VDLPGAAAGHPPPSVTVAERQPMSIDGIRGAAAMTSQVGASERQPPTTTVTAEVHLRRSDDSERRHGSSTTSTFDSARHRRDVRTSRGRTTPTYVAEISTSRTDVRLQCTSTSSRATDRPILMLAGRGSPTSAASLATGREPAQRARRSPPTSPQSQVASWLRETAGVLAPPPSHAAASQHSAACTDLQQASLPLGADAALISPPRGSGSGSRRTLVSRRSSAVVAEVLDFTKNLSNSLLQLTNQL